MAISTPRDNNRTPALVGTLNTNGVTPVSVYADPSAHTLSVSDGAGGSNFPHTNDIRDANRVTALMGTSNVDGRTPIQIYTDSSGHLLIQST